MKLTKGRILILDDDVAVGRSMVLMAEELDMESRCVTDIHEFFAAVGQWEPTHIILDLIMPEMDGVIVLEHLAKRTCKARIAISSGLGDRDLNAAQSRASELGLDVACTLRKPVRMSAIEDFLDGASPSES